ncbi:DNA-binding response OmpR family regulator [Friedmanniella endophytica]|uniref:DNA-binding response OmpR family regulator n=1 Tax=Microlunatus kandeliicorticis TaxID=1759536 RepID=A0A7W3IR40_9ACTN|nr:response regulator transcription factor [Microlunatus kandeliicorticis]MBA8793702.1 DNA-binding response OmpR family regulator [Microlunatus kandeliicorticis]
MPEPRVIIVEDDAAIGGSVVDALTDAGFRSRLLVDGAHLEAAIAEFRPDAVLLDWMLPGRDGPTLARLVRAHSSAAVIMVTAKDTVDERLRGFDAGVDDYLTKPFAMAELIARLSAVLRRTGALASVIEIGDLLIDADAGVITRAGHPVELTATERRLLQYLAENRDRVLSPTQILTQVWGYGEYADNLVQVHISSLRRKLEAHGPRLLHTVWGTGYVLRAAVPAEQS